MIPPSQRSEDRSFWWRTTTALEKYKLLVWLVVAALVAFGFDFQTPAAALRGVSRRVDALDSRVSGTEKAFRDLNQRMDIVIRLRCFDARPEQMRFLGAVGIDCAQVRSSALPEP